MKSTLLQVAMTLCSLSQLAAAQQFRNYIVTSLSAATHYGTPGSISVSRVRRQTTNEPYYHQVTFQVHDPQPATDATTRCEVWWPTTAAVPSWTACEDSDFKFQLLNWVDVDQFTLDVRHSYQDPAIGPPPFDTVTTWGKVDLAAPEGLSCVIGSQPQERYCGLVAESTELPVYQAVA